MKQQKEKVMKNIICAISIVVLVLCVGACTSPNYERPEDLAIQVQFTGTPHIVVTHSGDSILVMPVALAGNVSLSAQLNAPKSGFSMIELYPIESLESVKPGVKVTITFITREIIDRGTPLLRVLSVK
jgi:hypothetical protein